MDSVTVAHAKAHLSEVLEKVRTGSAITITRRGKPVALLQPVSRAKSSLDLKRIDSVRKKLPRARTDAINLVRTIRNERS